MIPHSLALDRNQQRLFIADRENGRVQVMNSKSGAFIDEIKFPEFGGLVYAVEYRYGERKLFFIPPPCVQLTFEDFGFLGLSWTVVAKKIGTPFVSFTFITSIWPVFSHVLLVGLARVTNL